MFHPNDLNDDSEHEEEYYDENDNESENNEGKVEVIVEIERPLTYVLGKPIVVTNGKIKVSKVKRPIIFNGTKNGWKSSSFVKGLTNDYVSNETWDFVENDWLRCDLRDIEVFWDEDEFDERLKEIFEKNPGYNSFSEAYEKYGYSIFEEVEVLKTRVKSN
tara:strand:- start:2822 stop:3304 length:483 start_codon:yes stop_codon:yes gene_type:complete